ncbi:MAG: S8 family peptidase, partial [Planctomycetota bacterium]
GWNLSHMPIRVTNSSGGGAFMSDITGGARWAVENGAQVANASYSGVQSSSVQSTGEYINSIGGSLTWSAGNDGRRYTSPDHQNVVICGATDSRDRRSSFSAYGPMVDVMAPGSSVYTTRRGGSYGGVSGTSFSAPLTAGLLALIWSNNPGLSPSEAEQILFEGCDDMGNQSDFGWGRINSFNSMQNSNAFRVAIVPDPLVGGQNGNVFALGGDVNVDTGAYFSLTGTGSTFINELGVSVDIANASEVGPVQRSDADGDAVWTRRVPNLGAPRIVWIQAAQASGKLTQVAVSQIN